MALSRTFKCGAEDLARLLDELKGLGAQVEGDERAGRLAGDTIVGRFEGTYEHDGDSLTIQVTAKPSLIPEKVIESQMDDLIRRFGGR